MRRRIGRAWTYISTVDTAANILAASTGVKLGLGGVVGLVMAVWAWATNVPSLFIGFAFLGGTAIGLLLINETANAALRKSLVLFERLRTKQDGTALLRAGERFVELDQDSYAFYEARTESERRRIGRSWMASTQERYSKQDLQELLGAPHSSVIRMLAGTEELKWVDSLRSDAGNLVLPLEDVIALGEVIERDIRGDRQAQDHLAEFQGRIEGWRARVGAFLRDKLPGSGADTLVLSATGAIDRGGIVYEYTRLVASLEALRHVLANLEMFLWRGRPQP